MHTPSYPNPRQLEAPSNRLARGLPPVTDPFTVTEAS
jgi:hypothetical protein